MTQKRNKILDADQVTKKVTRIAYEILENNFEEEKIFLVGIHEQGYVLAELLATELRKASEMKVEIIGLSLDKIKPLNSPVVMDRDIQECNNHVVVLIDDVLNSGRTLAHCLKPFLSIEVAKVEVAVLVNRSHTLFPLVPNYTGYELATTISDHIEVHLQKNQGVYLK